ncbi:uncharacterized protein CIMG_08219 [Coccidioides immitis RS]|uniref:Uncharacterized protein n=2 Tax=Coccidioides immitis TaxID=5501 RepID=A0A0E1RVB8_COCIM|nr:uncharacterized protein CIMG_08219 [Coccidioides immitis RS]EAS29473.1 hypothetical protein CIMG_08219 [Coccidioides immitis RS]KMU73706.1 hypothetical protein CISG_03756 [Coccidioides immitis RMSCC 3703]
MTGTYQEIKQFRNGWCWNSQGTAMMYGGYNTIQRWEQDDKQQMNNVGGNSLHDLNQGFTCTGTWLTHNPHLRPKYMGNHQPAAASDWGSRKNKMSTGGRAFPGQAASRIAVLLLAEEQQPPGQVKPQGSEQRARGTGTFVSAWAQAASGLVAAETAGGLGHGGLAR